MKILVYGAGVIGSYLAHVLVRGGNDVTMLARGKRVDELKNDGIVIRHYMQLKTTVDSVNIISTLQPDDVYDLIFVTMQFQQFETVLPILAKNQSRNLVLVGNNPDARGMQSYLEQNSLVKKQVAFGFQSSGGWRENGHIVCVRGGGHMDIGSLYGDLSWRPIVEKAFSDTKYKLVFYDNMDPWLKSHTVMYLVLGYAVNAYDNNLLKLSKDKKLLHQVVGATDEGYRVLETLGYTITPASVSTLAKLAHRRRNMAYLMIKVMLRVLSIKKSFSALINPETKLDEFIALNNAFVGLKQRANIPTPNWDVLENRSQTSK